MMLLRREFIGGALAALGLPGLAADQKERKPNLVFGVVSDIHIRAHGWGNQPFDTTKFHSALEWFRSQGVDAVALTGDIADHGQEEQMQAAAEAWFDVFPRKSGVVQLFVTGNHDWWGYHAVPKIDEAWTRVWGEKYESLTVREVKGYTMVGQHWENFEGCVDAPFDKVVPWLDAHAKDLKTKKPFFYFQHPHPYHTCHGNNKWHDSGVVTTALSKFPNAVAFSGHSHHPISRENAFWNHAFTSVGAGSLRYTNQGLLVKVFDDKVTFERHDFKHGKNFGRVWVKNLG